MAQTASEKSNGNGAKTSGSGEPQYEDLSRQIEAVKDDIARLTETLGNLGRSERDRLASAARARGEEIKAAGEEQYRHVRDTAEGYLQEGERYVKQQPGTALGMAVAVGFLVGFIMTSRR